MHWPDLETPFAETARTLETLRREGKIRAIGVSNFSPAQMNAFRAAAKLDAVQSPYNLFEREIEVGRVALCQGRRPHRAELWGAVPRAAQRTHEYRRQTFEGDDLRNVDPKFQGARFRQYLAAVDELEELARERFGKSVLALALRWVLDQGPTIALWGARRPEQLDPIGEIDGWQIDEASKRDIDAILKRCITDPVSPEFMAPPVTRPRERSRSRA